MLVYDSQPCQNFRGIYIKFAQFLKTTKVVALFFSLFFFSPFLITYLYTNHTMAKALGKLVTFFIYIVRKHHTPGTLPVRQLHCYDQLNCTIQKKKKNPSFLSFANPSNEHVGTCRGIVKVNRTTDPNPFQRTRIRQYINSGLNVDKFRTNDGNRSVQCKYGKTVFIAQVRANF